MELALAQPSPSVARASDADRLRAVIAALDQRLTDIRLLSISMPPETSFPEVQELSQLRDTLTQRLGFLHQQCLEMRAEAQQALSLEMRAEAQRDVTSHLDAMAMQLCTVAGLLMGAGITFVRADDPHRLASLPDEFDGGQAQHSLVLDYSPDGRVHVGMRLTGLSQGEPKVVEVFSVEVQGPAFDAIVGLH